MGSSQPGYCTGPRAGLRHSLPVSFPSVHIAQPIAFDRPRRLRYAGKAVSQQRLGRSGLSCSSPRARLTVEAHRRRAVEGARAEQHEAYADADHAPANRQRAYEAPGNGGREVSVVKARVQRKRTAKDQKAHIQTLTGGVATAVKQQRYVVLGHLTFDQEGAV